MTLLVLALVALLLGPLLGSQLESTSRLRAVLDGVIAVAVGALCLLALLPHAMEHMGPLAVAVVVGTLALTEVARRLRPRDSMVWDVVALGLLALHAAVDGAALAAVDHDLGLALGLAVALHRLPVGLVVYRAAHLDLPDKRGVIAGWAAVGLLAVATVGGFVSGVGVDGHEQPLLVGGLEAMVAGMLLHVVVEQLPMLRRVLSPSEPG